MPNKPSDRDRSPLVIEAVLHSVESLMKRGLDPTFDAILGDLRGKKVMSNQLGVRTYLDLMVGAKLLSRRDEPARTPNVRMKQVYCTSAGGPLVEVGERCLLFYGLAWTIPDASSDLAKTDIEGLARSRMQGTAVLGALEDAIVANLARARTTGEMARGTTFCAALLSTHRLDRDYLLRRASEEGVEEVILGLLNGISELLSSDKPDTRDLRTLSMIRRELAGRFKLGRQPQPSSSPLSQDELVDVIGKQLGFL